MRRLNWNKKLITIKHQKLEYSLKNEWNGTYENDIEFWSKVNVVRSLANKRDIHNFKINSSQKQMNNNDYNNGHTIVYSFVVKKISIV